MKKSLLGILAISFAIVSCNKDKPVSESVGFGSVESMEDLKVPSSFNWSSSKTLMTDISVENHLGEPRSKVRVDIYDKDPYVGGKVLASGMTNAQGKIKTMVKLKSAVKEVVVLVNALGVGGNRMTVSTKGDVIKAHFSGVPQQRLMTKNSSAPYPAVLATGYTDVYYLEAFNADGVPASVVANTYNVPVDPNLLSDLDMILPETEHVPCDPLRMHLLNDLFCNNVVTAKDDAEVFVTFLSEGAELNNALAYYYYPAGSPPATRADIDSIFVIFPYVSEAATNLNPGDRVKLGTFPKNTVIEWVLLGKAWVGGQTNELQGPSPEYFGRDALNTDIGHLGNTVGCPADPTFQQHMISFAQNMNGEEIQIFAFEDLQYPYGDFDFNDCNFFASGDLIPSCAPTPNIILSDLDSDQDGVIDTFDDAPNDPLVACIINFEGTVLYEDLWPSKGDYDFNDLVVQYDVDHAVSALGELHEVRGGWTIEAAGAGFNNGFGILLSDDIAPGDVVGVSGRTSVGKFPMDGDFAATPGSDLVVYNWDETDALVTNDIALGQFFNTVPGGGAGNPVTENIVIEFANGVEPWRMGVPPYNAFIFANQVQDKEIHLADMKPSSLNDDTRFGTLHDASNPGIGRYYKTHAATNLPWGLDIPKLNFEWPNEQVQILTAYPDFATWASSGGTMNTDWYDNPVASEVYP